MTDSIQSWLSSKPEDLDQWLVEGLNLGAKFLGMSTGIISRIKDDEYVIRAAYSTLGDIFTHGMSFELKNTYCEAVVREHKPITYVHVGSIPKMVLHPRQ